MPLNPIDQPTNQLKFCSILNVPSSRNLFVVLFTYRIALFFAHIFFSFIRFNLFSLNVLFALKHIIREIGIADYSE